MVTIRLMRRGGKKEPFYHVVVTDSRRAGGGSLEQVGFFNPVARGNSQELRLELDRVDYWLGVGAQPSERVQQLIKSYRKTQVAAAAARTEDGALPVGAPANAQVATAAYTFEVAGTQADGPSAFVLAGVGVGIFAAAGLGLAVARRRG